MNCDKKIAQKDSSGKKNQNFFLKIIWRFALLFIAIFLIRHTIKSNNANIVEDFRHADKVLLLVALSIFAFVHLLAAYRWQLLLKVQKMKIALFQSFKLTMTGVFFSMFIPGAVSGDLLKIAFAGQLFTGKKTEIFLTVMLDRIVGLFAMFFTASLATFFCIKQLTVFFAGQEKALAFAVILANCGSLACLMVYLLYRCQDFFVQHKFTSWLITFCLPYIPVAILGFFKRLYAALDMYKSKQKVLGIHLLCSMTIHLLQAFAFFSIGRALGEKNMKASEYILSTQIANAIGAMPFTPGGLGMRDAVSASFFKAFNASPVELVGSITTIFTFMLIIWAIIGGIFFLFTTNLHKYKVVSS